MKLRWLLQALAFSSLTITYHSLAKHITTFIPRSQGSDTARELVGWQRELYRCYTENYCAIAATAAYTHSMHTGNIARDLLTSRCLTFSGSHRTDRQPTDILADYFGLPVDFLGTLAIDPRIENYIIDLNLYFGCDELYNGLYLRIHAPITHTKWTLGLDSCIVCEPKFRGCPTFPGCYMFSSTSTVVCDDVNPMLDPLAQADGNCTTDSLRVALSGNFTFGDMKEPWRYGRFSFCPRDKTGIADIDAIMGYNFWHHDFSHFGFFVITVVPTGNRPKAKYIFEPLVGNGKHWEFGGGLTTHLSTANPCFNAGIYIEGNVTWVFNTHQIRSFDFTNNGPLSRYMLLKEFDPVCNDSSNNPLGEFQDSFEYNERLMNAINFATRNCEVHVGLKSDVSAKAYVSAGNWALDAGYNFWYRNKETICIRTECPCYLDQRFLGFKGTEQVCCNNYTIALVPPAGGGESVPTVFPYGTAFPAGSTAPEGCPALPATSTAAQEPSDATRPDATIFFGGNPISGPAAGCSACLNSGVITDANGTPTDDLTTENEFFVDHQPTLITCRDLDPHSAEQGTMMTHKVFAMLSYTWKQSCYEPFVGIGAEGEFDAHCNNALEQWGIWLKGGLTF